MIQHYEIQYETIETFNDAVLNSQQLLAVPNNPCEECGAIIFGALNLLGLCLKCGERETQRLVIHELTTIVEDLEA